MHKLLLILFSYSVFLGCLFLSLFSQVWGFEHYPYDDVFHHAYSYTDKGRPQHSSADDIQRLQAQRIYCTKYPDLCKKIETVDMTTQEQYFYTAISSYVIDRLDALMQPSLFDALYELKINANFGTRTACERNNRWCATHHYLTLNLWWMESSEEYMQVLTHELCHIIDLWILEWNDLVKDSQFTEFGNRVFSIDDPSLSFYRLSRQDEFTKKKNSNDLDFFSEYGQTNPFEDFAESCNAYLNHKDYFARLSSSNTVLKAKYDFFDDLFWQGLFFSNKNYSTSNTYRVRDSTNI